MGLFSFLRGRLRTIWKKKTIALSFYGFHSFEVGFGLSNSNGINFFISSFHSFEVGFGLYQPGNDTIISKMFSFLRGRLRTTIYRNPYTRVKLMFSFLRGRLRTAAVEKIVNDEIVFSFLRGRLRT